jgi:hypothetical protein
MENIFSFILGWYAIIGSIISVIAFFIFIFKSKSITEFLLSLLTVINIFLLWPLLIYEIITGKNVYSKTIEKLFGNKN